MSKIQYFMALVLVFSVASFCGAEFLDDFNRPDGDVGNDWTIQTDGTIEVKIVDNEVLIAGEQGTDWARAGISRAVGDETIISFDFKADDSLNVHLRIDDVASGAYIDTYAWPGGPFSYASSEDGGWPGWVSIDGSDMIPGEYNTMLLEQEGTEFTLTLNDVVISTITNGALTDIGSFMIASDAAAGTVGSLHIDNVMLMEPAPLNPGPDNLVAYYALDGNADDGSGNDLHGVVVGDANYVDGPAGYGMAMEFYGDSYVDCGNDPILDINGPISISLWIRPDAEDPEGQATNTAPLCKAMDGMSPSWSWQVRYGWNSPQPYMAFTFNTSPRAWAYVGQNLEQYEWAHISCSHDGETLTAYLNGKATESTPMGAITNSDTPVLIGSDGWGSNWIGAIDEVAIYDRGLSDREMRFLASDMTPVDPGLENLAAYFPLDNDANDVSGNGNDGTLVGDPIWVDGLIGAALEYDGVDDYVETGTNLLPASGDFSISLWLTADSAVLVEDDRAAIEQGPIDSAGDRIYLYSSTDFGAANGQVRVWSDTTGQVLLGPDIRGVGWKHLVLMRSADYWELYVDGTLYSTGSNANAIPEGQLFIGGASSDGRYHFGQIDDVRIYDRALSVQEVLFIVGEN